MRLWKKGLGFTWAFLTRVLFWFGDEQMARPEPYVPKPHGKPRVDDRRVLNGIIFVDRCGLRWRDAPAEYGASKALYTRWKRWRAMRVFARMMSGMAETTDNT